MNLIDEIEKPVIFGHRGASKFAPENTMAAFDLAFSDGVPAIELDTMLSQDGIPVVIHDHTLERTTNGVGRVDQLPAAELTQLDAGSSFSSQFKGEPIPLLKDVFARYKGKMLINVELKNMHAPLDRLPFVVAQLVKELDNLDSLIFSSFLPLTLLRLKKVLPQAKTALLVGTPLYDRMLSKRFFSFLSPDYIHPSRDYITPRYLAREHRYGRQVNVWTVNDLAQAEQFISWGIDGMITDDPQGLLNLNKQSH
jgi:glycerophosphoryl diester phosphodiesterase